MARLAGADSRPLSASHQRNAWVSSRNDNLPAFPGSKLIPGKWIEETVREVQLPFQDIGLALSPGLAENKAHDRLATTCDHHIVARFRANQQAGKLGFGLMNIDNVHV